MFTIPSLSSLSPSNWIPSSLSSRITHYVIKRALGFCFDLPADWQASNLDTGALVLDDLHLDVNVGLSSPSLLYDLQTDLFVLTGYQREITPRLAYHFESGPGVSIGVES